MVDQKVIKGIETEQVELPEVDLNWTSIKLSEVREKANRLEASVFNIEAKAARQVLKECKWPIVNLWSENGLIDNAQYPGRFKRIYVEENDGIPFFLPSQITDIYPKPNKWISPLTHSGLEVLKAKEGELLLNRSGTIGPVSIVNKTFEGKLLSDDVIRITTKDKVDLGYLYAFLRTKTGQTLLATNSYGAVISHIEPKHLENLPIPNPARIIKQNIHAEVIGSFRDIDKSNELIDDAENLLIAQLELPKIENLQPKFFDENADIQNYQVRLSKLNNRLDASYHVPSVDAINQHLYKNAAEVTTIGDNRVSNEIILPGRFKRVYVEEGQGMPFIGGKQIYELDPSNKKFLSLSHHSSRIKDQLYLHENMIVVTCSGTIGKINIIPKHWENWTMNQHVMRIVPANDDISGFIYSWLNTDYGYELIKRFTYGAVVDEIHDHHISKVAIPLLKDKNVQSKINRLVLEANDLRYKAYKNEQKAIKMVNDLVIYAIDDEISLPARKENTYYDNDNKSS